MPKPGFAQRASVGMAELVLETAASGDRIQSVSEERPERPHLKVRVI